MSLKFVSMKFFLLLLGISATFLFAQPTFSASLSEQINTQIDSSASTAEIGDGKRSPQVVIAGLIKAALGVFGIIFLGLVIYGGFTVFSARGAADQVESGLDIIRRAVIGLAIVLAAYSLSYAIGKIIQNSASEEGIQDRSSGKRYDQIF